MATTLVIRDQYGIHPDDVKFVQEKVKEIVELLRKFKFLEMSASEQACLIGQVLNELQPKIFKGQWLNFLQDHFGKFRTTRTFQNWMLMARFRPALLKSVPPKSAEMVEPVLDVSASQSTISDVKSLSPSKSTTYTSPSNLPTIETSVKLIQGWMRQQRSKSRATPKKREPREYCPTCGQFLSKRVKTWMKHHGSQK